MLHVRLDLLYNMSEYGSYNTEGYVRHDYQVIFKIYP